MDKKITRRVVLGTTIAGLAAGPFVMRYLRRTNELDRSHQWGYPLSEGRLAFFNQWKKIHNELSVKKEHIVNFPKTVVVKRDFSTSRSLPFRSLDTWFGCPLNSPENAEPTNLMRYILVEGKVNIGGGKVRVSVDKHESRHVVTDVDASEKNGLPVAKTVVQNPDGTQTVHRAITVSGFRYDSVKGGYKTDLIHKEIVASLGTGQFILSSNLELVEDNGRKLRTSEESSLLALFASGYFHSLIGFPLPSQSAEINKKYECPLNVLEAMCANSVFPLVRTPPPFTEALYRGMVRCREMDTLHFVPFYGSVESYHKCMREWQEARRREVVNATWTSDEEKSRGTAPAMKFFEQLKQTTSAGFPELNYYIDPETGWVVRREEYTTHTNLPKYGTGFQRIFQLG